MLIRLLRAYLRPYRKGITAVVVLQLVQTLATLYLPTLNADIIDNGVITGNTHYILRIGAVMLAVAFVQIVCSIGAVYFGAKTAMAFGRDVRQGGLPPGRRSPPARSATSARPSLITRTTNDVQQVQMLALLTFTLMVSAPIMCVGGIIMALNQDVPLSSLLLVAVPALGIIVALIISPDAAAVPADAGRASTRSTGCCASRSPASGWSGPSSGSRASASGSARPTRSCSTCRSAPAA